MFGHDRPSLEQFADCLFRRASAGSQRGVLKIEGSSISHAAKILLERIAAAAQANDFTPLLLPVRRFRMCVLFICTVKIIADFRILSTVQMRQPLYHLEMALNERPSQLPIRILYLKTMCRYFYHDMMAFRLSKHSTPISHLCIHLNLVSSS